MQLSHTFFNGNTRKQSGRNHNKHSLLLQTTLFILLCSNANLTYSVLHDIQSASPWSHYAYSSCGVWLKRKPAKAVWLYIHPMNNGCVMVVSPSPFSLSFSFAAAPKPREPAEETRSTFQLWVSQSDSEKYSDAKPVGELSYLASKIKKQECHWSGLMWGSSFPRCVWHYRVKAWPLSTCWLSFALCVLTGWAAGRCALLTGKLLRK